jgi:hypothetical protein
MLEGSKDEFAVRFYRWALGDIHREIQQGCSLIRLVRGVECSALVDYLGGLSKAEKDGVARSFAKNAHRYGAELCGNPWGDEDSARLESFRASMFQLTLPYISSLFSGPRKKPNKRRLRDSIMDKLPEICGEVYERESGYTWTHARGCEGWTIFTEVDLSSTSAHLTYLHYIRATPQEEHDLLDGQWALLSWMGFNAETKWDMLAESEEENAAGALATICRHFFEAASEMLNGLPR